MAKLVTTTRRLAAVFQFTFLLAMTVLSITKSLVPADTLLFFPSKLQIPDSPQFVPVWTDFEVLNNNPQPKTIQIRHSHCSWISVVISTADIDAYGTLAATVVTSPFMREGPHQCVIELLAGNASYSYTVDWTVLSNQYDIRPHKLIGSKSDILLEPSRFFSQIPLKNPFAEPLLIHEATAESDYINVFIGSESKATRVNSSSILRYSISKPRARPGVYHEYIAVQTSFDRVVIPITVYQTEENLRFVERELDFGTLHARGEKKSRQIVVEYSGMDDIIIKNIYLRHSSPFTTVKVFEPALPVEGNRTVVGTVTFRALASGEFEGSILVETQSSSGEIVKELPFKAAVRFENHIVSPNLAVLRLRPFQRGGRSDRIRLSFEKGRYIIPLSDDSFVIEEAQLVTCQNVLAIDHFMQEGRSVLVVHVLRDIEEEEIKSGLRTCWVEVASNASFHKVPLHLSTGRVELDALQGKLVDHETRLSISGEMFRDVYVADIGHISQFEPRDEKIAISNYNPADEVVTAFVADMDACLCLLAYVPIGFNSLSRVSAEMRALAVEDFVKVQPLRSSRCACTGRSNSPWGMEIRAGYHSIFAIVADRMRPTPLASTQYINSSHVAVKTSAVRILTDHQEISLALRYRPFSRTVGFECVSAPFCSTFPLGMRQVNIRVAVPTADHANARLLFDALTSTTTLNAAFKWADSKQSVFDCRLSVATPQWQASVLFARSVWYAALALMESANVDARALVDRLISIENSCVTDDGGVDYSRLFTELEDFKSRLSAWFSSGFPFKPTGILVSSQELSKSFAIEAPVAVLPHQVLPDGYDVDLLVGGNRISHLYVEYFNPFEMEVSVAIVSNYSVGAIKRTAEESSSAMVDERLHAGRKIPVRYRVGPTSPSEVVLTGAVILDTLDGSRAASPFLKLDGDQPNAATHQAENLVRFPQRSWLVPPRQKIFIGPIEVSGSGKESSTSFSALVFNSFSGFDALSVHINNSPSKFVVHSIAACEQDRHCVPVSASSPSNAHESVAVRFERSAPPRRYELVLQNVGPPFLVNNLLWGGISCLAGAANHHLYIDQVFRRTGFVSLCGQLPVEVPHNATLQLDLPLPELAIFESIPLLLTLQEQASPQQAVPISSFNVGFAFASDASSPTSAELDAILVAAALIVAFIGSVSTIASLGVAIDSGRKSPHCPGLHDSLDALTSKNAQQRVISPMATTKTETHVPEEACVALRFSSKLGEELRAQKETLVAKWKATRESSNRTADLRAVPSEQPAQADPEAKPSAVTADAPARTVEVLHSDRTDRSDRKDRNDRSAVEKRQKVVAPLRSSSPKLEPVDSIAAPPGLPPHPQFPVDLVGNNPNPLSSFVDGTDFDDSPLFRYQGQLLGMEDESADFQFEDGVVGEGSALENKFLQSISSVHQDGGILSSLSSLRFTVNLDLESELDLTGNLDLLRSTEGERSIFDDLTDSDSFYPSMPLGSILSFLNEPSSSTNEQPGSIFGRRQSPGGAAENFRWFGANQVETPDRSFFGPNEFFNFAEGVDLEEELEK